MIRKFRTAAFGLLIFSCCFVGMVISQSYSDQQLLDEGHKARDQRKCVQASKFFFAYMLRNPKAAAQSSIPEIITWCENNTVVDASDKGDSMTPPMPSLRLPPSTDGQPGVFVGPPPPMTLPASPRCDIYATLATAQNRANWVNSCGFTGARWNSSYPYHYNWCTSVPSEMTRAETQVRQNMLNQCAP